jgi:hypothetical protein
MNSGRICTFAAIALSSMVLGTAALARTGDPLPDVDVSLDRKLGGFVKQVKTDAQGNFTFGVVSAGDYVITVKPNALTAPQVGQSANATPTGATAKTFNESRPNAVRTVGTNPLRFQVTVNAKAGSAMRAMQSDGNQQMQISTAGGPLGGRITAQ